VKWLRPHSEISYPDQRSRVS